MTNRLDDGFKTIVTFANAPTIKLYEKEVTPPGLDGGGEIDTTTMRNTLWRTRHPKALITLSEMSFTSAYDPVVFTDLLSSVLNTNQLITVTFPDLSTLQFWGWLDKFTPNAHVEGEQPTAECTIIPSNQNASGIETAPVYA